MTQPNDFTDPDSAIAALAGRLAPVGQTEECDQPLGRILADPVLADRDSPAADVSAMDGYAIRLEDLAADAEIPIGGESSAGAAPPKRVAGEVIRIFTGAMVPEGCEAVVKREDTVESERSIRFRPAAIESTVLGSNIRRGGENAPAGSQVLPAGFLVRSATIAALANFAAMRPSVFRRVRVAVLTTGDEVLDEHTVSLKPWQLRNSNRAVSAAMLGALPFVDVHRVQHVIDDVDAMRTSLGGAIETSDAVIVTGGVSKGDYDYVPETIADLGGEIVFHGLPIRPGKPILGAATGSGKLILGLPGNPVSASINCHRFAIPLLRKLGGCDDWTDHPAKVLLRQPPRKAIPLHAMLLARACGVGEAELVTAKGSGDLVALGKSDGYVCVDPMQQSTGPWPMFSW